MNKALTVTQKKVVATIRDLFQKGGKSPTLEEIREAMGYSSIYSVQRHVDALKKKGVLSSKKHQSRSLELNLSQETVNIPLVGNVACGRPLLAKENIEAYVPYDKTSLQGNPADYFFLRAVGDSMNASTPSIDDGDFVLIKKYPAAEDGQRIVALVGDEATIKRYRVEDKAIKLEPESTNEENKPILLFEDPLIQGIVVSVVRKEESNIYD